MSQEPFVAIAATLHNQLAAGSDSIANLAGGLGAGEAAELKILEALKVYMDLMNKNPRGPRYRLLAPHHS